jgi:hypothetical protein
MKKVERKYGFKGRIPEQPTQCIAVVYSGGIRSYQCERKRGYGPGGLYCKQHAKIEARKTQNKKL